MPNLFQLVRLKLALVQIMGAGHYHLRPADGVFQDYMRELGIHPSEDAVTIPEDPDLDGVRWIIKLRGQERIGMSTIKKWCCPECGLNVRMGIASDPMQRHHTREIVVGRPIFLIPGNVYMSKK